MPDQTIQIYSVGSIPIFRTDNGNSLQGNNPLRNAVNGDAFSWQNPSNVALTFDAPNASITFDEAGDVLNSAPVNGNTVTDQLLSQPTTIDGVTYQPGNSDILWQSAVYVRAEFSVTLFDGAGNEYTMLGVSIVEGYTIRVAGVTFIGDPPPPGTTLTYIQGQSSFGGSPEVPFSAICFSADALIMTQVGEIRIGDLRKGMMVQTRDNGYQPVRWIGSRRVGAGELAMLPRLRPIRISRGALGAGTPSRDLVVSPQHRILVRSKIALRMFGAAEILVAAKHLLDIDGIDVAQDLSSVTYVHILLDDHQIVHVDGAEAETLYTGPEALKTLSAAARQEICSLFPQMDVASAGFPHARQVLSGREGRSLAGRHSRNRQPLVQ